MESLGDRGPEEGATGLSVLNPNPARLPGPSLLHELVRAESLQDGPAIDFLSSERVRFALSYRELHARADKLAGRITEAIARQQPQRGDEERQQLIVPVLVPQCPDLYVSLLAILKAGGAFCPLNLDAPPERVRFILHDVSARVVLTTADLVQKIPRDREEDDETIAVIAVDSAQHNSPAGPGRRPPRAPRPADLAYVMYTSGSTGTPKGVGISHSAATQALLAHDAHIPPFRRFLQLAAPTFDVSVFDIFFPLFRGATLVSCARSTMLDDLPRVLRDMDVDACELTPTVAGSLLRKRENAPGLKLLLTIGEMLTGPVVREFGGDGKGRESILWAMYGPTEATIHCTLQPAFRDDATVNNIGCPLSTVSAFVLAIPEEQPQEKSHQHPPSDPHILPIGEIGELAVGGFQLADGYINRPEQTASAFIETASYGRLYRTGDKARLRRDGLLECLGRISEGQVKLRGQRIELGEVEAAVLRVAGCHGAVAAVVGGATLVVFCTLDKRTPAEEAVEDTDVARITDVCAAWLPRFMLPNDVVVLKDFPRLPSGKVDRKRLVSDYEDRIDNGRGGATFRDQLERDLCRVAGEVLGVQVAPSTKLTSSGMDSILAIRFASLLRQTGLDVSAIEVLAARTPAHLHASIHKRQHPISSKAPELAPEASTVRSRPSTTKLPAVLQPRAEHIESIVPCTPLQEAMLAETARNPQAYCNRIELAFSPECSPRQILAAFEHLAVKNKTLRTGFAHVDGRFVQAIWRKPDLTPKPQAPEPAEQDPDDQFDFRIETDEQLLRPLFLRLTHGSDGPLCRLYLHHAIYDGWSTDILISDLDSLLRGDILPDRPQFHAVCQYNTSSAHHQASDDARAFWAEQLLDFQPPPFPQLITTTQQTSETLSTEFIFDTTPAQLKQLAKELECSTQVFFQACVVLLWGMILGVDDVVIGTVTSGRTLPVPGIEQIMGPCLASVPLRARLGGETRSIREFLVELHAANRALLPHSILPLAEIKKTAGLLPTRTLYDVLFVYQESLFSKRTEDCLVRQVGHQDYLETKVLVEVEPRKSDFSCRITYHVDCLPHDLVELVGTQLRHLLRRIVANINSRVDIVRPQSIDFPEPLLSLHNTKPTTLKGCADLARAVESNAARFPDKEAVCFATSIASDNSMVCRRASYQDLNSFANQVGHCIRSHSQVETGDVVAIIMEKSIELYAGILGILKAGCAYLPLLPSTPLARVEVILRQANVRLCLTDLTTVPLLRSIPCKLLNIQEVDLLQAYPDGNLNIPPDPSRVANVIYTSGTTGVPKGVCVTQLNIVSNLDVLSRIYPVSESSRLLQSCSQAFDVSVFEIFFAWTTGMCLCSAANDTLFEDLERAIRVLGVSHLSMTPTVAALVDPRNVPGVEFLVTSGEPMTGPVANKWTGLLYQGYGPSETTNICTVKKMTPGDVIRHLGFGFENTSSFVLDRKGGTDIVPRGCLGELCFGGDQVVQGYLDMPALTDEKFIIHPQHGRLYRSGDLGRMLPDGSLMIVGRADDQVKLRGQRVELAEIDAVVRGCEGVGAALTLLVSRDGEADTAKQLATFYVQSALDTFTGSQGLVLAELGDGGLNGPLFAALVSRLPGYMVPSYLVPISAIPLTAAGKLDKDRLRTTFRDLPRADLESLSCNAHAASGDESDKEEWSQTDLVIARAVAETLGVKERTVRRWTPFVSLGLDSISAITVARRLRDALGVRIPISEILQNACVARLGQAVTALQQQDLQPRPRAPLEAFTEDFVGHVRGMFADRGLDVETVLPCTPLQEAMLAASPSGSGRSYLNQTVFRLAVDAERMEWCWEQMVRRHPILRTCFVTTDQPRHAIAQVALRDWSPRWQHFSVASQEEPLDVSLRQQHAAGLSCAVDSFEPPVSFATVKTAQGALLVFTCHHALYDGVAVTQLLREVEGLVSGEELRPPPEYEAFLQEMASLPDLTDQFWRDQLAGLSPTALPRETSKTLSHQSHLTLDLPQDMDEITARLKGMGVSLLASCQAAWAATLTTLLRTPDICFGNVVSGRGVPLERIDELVAPCFNTIPVRVNTSEARTNIDLMKTLHRAGLEALQYQFTPLRRIQGLVCPGGGALFDTLLLLQQPPRPLDPNIWTLERDEGAMDVPVVCEITPEPPRNRLRVQVHHDSQTVGDGLATFLLRLFSHSLQYTLKHPSGLLLSDDSLPAELRDLAGSLSLEYESAPAKGHGPGETSRDEETGTSWTETERAVREVMASLSSSPEHAVTHRTTIYQLGLDSISAVQIAAALRKRGCTVSATDVMEHSACADLAAFLDRTAAQAAFSEETTRKPASYDLGSFQHDCRSYATELTEAILPCTPLQHGMLTEFVNSGGVNYFNFIDLGLKSGFEDTEALVAAWRRVTTYHEMLRTGFIPVEHKDVSFAMVRFVASAAPDRIVTVRREQQQQQGPEFDLVKWRQDSRQETLDALETPPWKVAVVEGRDGVWMHLAIHHALYDAQSLQLILNDLRVALGGGQLAPHPSVDGAVSVLMQSSKSVKSEAKAFWEELAPRAVVNRFPVMTPLRVDRRSTVVESATGRLPFSSLEAGARASGSSVQAIIQAAWTRVLCSYLGESSAVFGVVLSGRDSEATYGAPFPCITTLPVVAENVASNADLVAHMTALNAKLRRHQHAPLTQIQKWLGFPHTRIFDTLLVYQKLDVLDRPQGPQEKLWDIVDDSAAVDYPVSMEIEPEDDIVRYRVTFYDDTLPLEQAKLLLQQFDAALCHLALYPEASEDNLWAEIPLPFSITPAENPKLPTDIQFLHEFVERSAHKTAGAIALEFVSAFAGNEPVSRCWTFAELEANGNRVAHLLAPHTSTGGIVAVYFDKCPEAYFAILGVLKAGCAFVALDPRAPPARRQFIVQDSGATALLTDVSTAETLDFVAGVPVIGLDEEIIATSPSSLPLLDRETELSPQDRCYCLYTSGTTGTPKGCEITHENAVQAMLAFQHLFAGHWDADSRWLQFASFHFDVSVLEQYWSWAVGIRLVAAPRDLILEDLVATISRLAITHIDLTPSLARLVSPEEVPSLCKGVFITGGEQLKQEILDIWGDAGVVYNAYGPTEATIGVTMYQRVPRNGRASNIGRQFPNVGSFVFKPGTETPVLRGGVGELCISGKLVGRGYLNREDLTRERFPTLEKFGERVYRTGDVVRILHNGCFDFLGRADDQVKLRGQRLEIGEINHAIRAGVPAVEDVATLVIRDEKKQKDLLVSFVVAKGQTPTSPELVVDTSESVLALSGDVLEACRAKLPGYMVPTYVLQLPFIPLSSNNKAEVKELRRLFNALTPEELVASSSSSASPSSSSELLHGNVGRRVLAALRAMDLLQDAREPGASTSIFELGIDSISALRLSRALKRGGLDQASPALILRRPVLGDLVRALQTRAKAQQTGSVLEARQLVEACQHRNRAQACRVLGVSSDQVEYIAPCSALQQGMISRSKTDEHRGAYFNVFTFELHDDVDVVRLRAAWQTIVDAFSILRTRFISSTEGFVQVALKETQLLWQEVTIGDDATVDSALEPRFQEWVDRNDKDILSPLELIFVSLPDGRRVLRLHIFHGLYDANSLGMITAKAGALYLGTEGIESRTTFIDALVHGPLRGFSHTRPFWEDHLRGACFWPLPILADSPTATDIAVSRSLSFGALEPARRALNVTHSALVQALWTSVLRSRCYPETASLTVGIIVFGRAIDVENAEHVVGPLFNTLPFHVPSQPTTWASLARQCHDFHTATLPFQHVPLRDVQKWCAGGRALFDTLFSCQREPLPSPAVSAGLWTELPSTVNADYPLAFEATLTRDSGLDLLLVAQSGVADEECLQGMLEEFEKAMTSMAADWEGVVDASPAIIIRDGGAWPVQRPRRATNEPSDWAPSPFDWTSDALVLRAEIATLAGVNPETVTEGTGLLELGLDSIDTIKLSARLRKRGIAITNSQLIRGQTIRRLADFFHHTADTDAATNVASRKSRLEDTSTALRRYLETQASRANVDPANVEVVLPPTPLQDAMVAEMVHSGFRRYFNHDILELSPDVDERLLQNAWRAVLEGSPVLRTTFWQVESSEFDFAHCQVVLRHMELPWEVIQVDGKDDIRQEIETIRHEAEQGGGASNMFRLTMVRTAEMSRFLVLSISHALYDGWSLGLLHQDVHDAYEGRYTRRESYLSYLDHILLSVTPEAGEFWTDTLTGATPTHIQPRKLADRPRPHPSVPSSIEEAPLRVVHRLETPSATSPTDLTALCRRQAVSAQVVGQVCWAAVLARHAQSLDVTFGSVLSGRETEESEALLFPTMNTVPVRAVLHGSVGGLLRYAQENMARVNQFQHFPLRKAQRVVAESGGGGGSEGLFNSLFLLQKRREEENGGDGGGRERGKLLMKSFDGDSAVEYPVCVEMEVIDAQVIWRTACDDAFLGGREATQLLRDLDAVLSFLVQSSPDASIFTPPSTTSSTSGGDEVSVCGLPPFRPRSSPTTTEMSSQTDAATLVNDEDWSPRETTIRSVLAEVSGVAEGVVKRSHSLYHLGLDSISAIKVIALLRRRGLELRVRDLLRAECLADMAAIASAARAQSVVKDDSQSLVGAAGSNGTPAAALATLLKQVDVESLLQSAGAAGMMDRSEGILPASPMQVHMISVWQNTDGQIFFPEFRYSTASGFSTSLTTIEAAWTDLVRETPVLRTTFLATGNRAVPFLQVVLRPAEAYCAATLNRTASPDNKADKAMLVSRPLVELTITPSADSDGSWTLSLRIHHALYDGVSLPLLVQRLEQLLGADNQQPRKVGHSHGLDIWKSKLTTRHLPHTQTTGKAFWCQYLEGVKSAVNTPSISADQALGEKGRVSKLVPGAVPDVSGLRAVAAARGVSVQALFLAAVAKHLAKTWRQGSPTKASEDVVFGVYLANRDADEDEKSSASSPLACYPTLSLLPLRVRDLSVEEGALVAMAAAIQRDLALISNGAYASVGLWEIAEWTGVRVDCFVNFLSLPSSSVIGGIEEKKQAEVEVRTTARLQPVRLDDDAGGAPESNPPSPAEYPWLEPNTVSGAFPDAVDIEAAINEEGGLDIGVFGSMVKLLGKEKASELIRGLVGCLGELGEDHSVT